MTTQFCCPPPPLDRPDACCLQVGNRILSFGAQLAMNVGRQARHITQRGLG